MATITNNIVVTNTWKLIPFTLISNTSPTVVEFWASNTAPTASNIGHNLPSTGLDKSLFNDDTVNVYFRSRETEAVLTVTESI